ncbi:MAG TPA: hypothetical protein VKA98_01390, partial [Nitrososphaeraceae archaeon]|nr:hypothetical protein [Nitrososphaeraceae archaeon]
FQESCQNRILSNVKDIYGIALSDTLPSCRPKEIYGVEGSTNQPSPTIKAEDRPASQIPTILLLDSVCVQVLHESYSQFYNDHIKDSHNPPLRCI